MTGIAHDSRVHDVVGVGFGPSNLALAIALTEGRVDSPDAFPGAGAIDAVFLERSTQFEWHPGMLLPGTGMQIAFPKDLVTFRNPRSEYSFVNYLFEQNRLVDFVNRQTFFPSRAEFADYLQWASTRVPVDVRYGCDVTRVDVEGELFRVHAVGPDGRHRELLARTVVHGPGLSPRVPDGILTGTRVIHNSRLLDDLGRLGDRPHGRIAVVGAGQSAAECLQYLHAEYTDSEVHGVFARFGMSPSDDSPYANRVFDPDTVDRWYGAPEAVRDRLLRYHLATNYAAVDLDVINDLYEKEYDERFRGARRLFMHGATEVRSVTESGDGVTMALTDLMSGEQSTLTADLVVLATGYEPNSPRWILGPGTSYRFDDRGPCVERDYRLSSDDPAEPPMFLNGGVEHTHGLTATLLSNIAMRSGEIADAIRGHLRGDAEPPAEDPRVRTLTTTSRSM